MPFAAIISQGHLPEVSVGIDAEGGHKAYVNTPGRTYADFVNAWGLQRGDQLTFVNCRFLGHQDTIYTGNAKTRLFFDHCYIEGTTDFIFGPSTAWFEDCDIFCKANSYITAASTPQDVPYGYIFNNCRITTANDVDKVFLGRPWRDYGYTLFMNCDLPKQIRPEGWHKWREGADKTCRYMEYNNRGEGAKKDQRVTWSRQLTKKEAQKITREAVFSINDVWNP
jgi:pectin methylesterase-like acyl-CoA thioesterase